ncbi:glutathione S-transferase family protein [Devosia equisanguinis]
MSFFWSRDREPLAVTITFFHMQPGPFAERCLMALRLKGIGFEEVILDPTLGQNRTPEFLSLNPRGTLPVLQDGSVVVRESQAIMFYLDKAYSEPPLFGTTPKEAGAIMQAIWDQTSYIEPLLKSIIGPLVFGKGDLSAVDAVEQKLVTELEALDRVLALTGWIVGNAISAADLSLYPLLFAVRASLREPAARNRCQAVLTALDQLPNLRSWLQAIAKIDGAAIE